MEEEIGRKQDKNKTIPPVKLRAKEQFPSSFLYVKRSLEEEDMWEILPIYRKAVKQVYILIRASVSPLMGYRVNLVNRASIQSNRRRYFAPHIGSGYYIEYMYTCREAYLAYMEKYYGKLK